MRSLQGKLPGVFLMKLDRFEDERGAFTKSFEVESFHELGLNCSWQQVCLSETATRGTIRGLHWQAKPFSEIKLIRCVRGSVFDVLVDVRVDSPCFGQWESYELSEGKPEALYVPEGIAHGFQSLEDNIELLYQISAPYIPGKQRGLRWDDCEIGIDWPLASKCLSNRDLMLPTFKALQNCDDETC